MPIVPETSRTPMSSPEQQPNRVSQLRRSQRVCLSVPIAVIKGGQGKNQASEETRTLIVSAHGALLVLHLPVQAGELLTLRHTKTQEELICRVVNVSPEQSGRREVSVEFQHPSPRFWRIAFPPADWSPRSADAKSPTAHSLFAQAPLKKSVAAPAEGDKKQSSKAPGPVPSAGS